MKTSLPQTKASSKEAISRPLKLALVSCGLGNVNRGFEASTARWYFALKNEPSLEVKLFAGGKVPGAETIWNLTRDSLLAGPLAYVPLLTDQHRWEFAYGIEQVSFALSLLPDLLKWKPDVVWTKEAPFAHFLDVFRSLFNLKYKIIFANGGAFKPNTYKQFDFIQHLQSDSYQDGLSAGIPKEKMQILCNCVPYIPVVESKQDLRKSFGFADTDWIIVSVAAWNKYHKRIDYLINEVASLNEPNLKLFLVGHPDTETDGLRQFAKQKLGNKVTWLTLTHNDVQKAVKLSDVFVLSSLHECLGGSLIDAAMTGVPVITHPHPGAKFILQDNYWMVDLSKPENLAKRLLEFKNNPPKQELIESLKATVIDRFDETKLSKQFTEMVYNIVNSI